MIRNRKELYEILKRVESRRQTNKDIAILRNAFKFDGEHQFIQVGNENISIGIANDITIRRIYNGSEPEIIEQAIKKISQEIKPVSNTPIALLRKFEQTEDCNRLLENCEKIGFQFTPNLLIRDIIVFLVSIFGLCYSIKLLITPKNGFLNKTLEFFLFVSSLFFIIFSCLDSINKLKKILNKQWLIEEEPVLAIPVFITKQYRENDKLETVILETTNNERYYAIPHPNFDGSTLCDGDVGVVYLRRDNNKNKYNALYVILYFKLASCFNL